MHGHRLYRRPGLTRRMPSSSFELPAPRLLRTAPRIPKPARRWHDAATMAGMAFANAFLGVMPLHGSQARRLPSHARTASQTPCILTRGACATTPIRSPVKMGTFPQYEYPHTRWTRYADMAPTSLRHRGQGRRREVCENLIAKLIEAVRVQDRRQARRIARLRRRRGGFPRHA